MIRKQNEREQAMGMAASQARFLGLTARKTNTEYEGQQINQQRTTLSNQSANYYNQLLGMTVPVPPSVSDYTKTVYTFTDGALDNSINSLIATKDGKYIVSYTSTWINDFSVIASNPVLYTRVDDGAGSYDYYVGAKQLRNLDDFAKTSYTVKNKSTGVTTVGYPNKDGNLYTGYDAKTGQGTGTVIDTDDCEVSQNFKDEYLSTLSISQVGQLITDELEYKQLLTDKYGASVDGWMVRYVQNTSTGTWSPFFANKDILESAKYSDTGVSQSAIKTYTVGSAKETEEIKGVEARLEQDATGRIISITLRPDQPDEVTYSVTTNTNTDQAKYQDAMNQYEYDKYEYDQSIQEINAKIEIIQTEDKNLEVRLKQLDTEQEAIQTEMDAVQKVIEKNTESTFKTFG